MSKFNVPEMSCGHCTSAIEKEIKAADPAAEINCDLSDRTVSVQTSMENDAILGAIKEAGYDAQPV